MAMAGKAKLTLKVSALVRCFKTLFLAVDNDLNEDLNEDLQELIGDRSILRFNFRNSACIDLDMTRPRCISDRTNRLLTAECGQSNSLKMVIASS